MLFKKHNICGKILIKYLVLVLVSVSTKSAKKCYRCIPCFLPPHSTWLGCECDSGTTCREAPCCRCRHLPAASRFNSISAAVTVFHHAHCTVGVEVEVVRGSVSFFFYRRCFVVLCRAAGGALIHHRNRRGRKRRLSVKRGEVQE